MWRILNILIFLLTTFAGTADRVNITGWEPHLIDEGPCIEPSPQTAEFELDWIRAALTSDWYMTLVSKMYIYASTKLLTGQPKTETDYLDKMCLKYSPEAPVSTIVGIRRNKETEISCRSERLGIQECYARNRTNHADEKYVKSVVTWTDNKKYIFMTLCVPPGKRAWVMLGNEKPGDLQEVDKMKIAEHIESLEFNPDLAYNFSYETCEPKKPLVRSAVLAPPSGVTSAPVPVPV